MNSRLFQRLMQADYVGIDESGRFPVTGYDQTRDGAAIGAMYAPELGFEPEDFLTRDEKLQLADEMVARWQRYRANVMRSG